MGYGCNDTFTQRFPQSGWGNASQTIDWTFRVQTGSVQLWNRDSTATLYVNFNGSIAGSGGNDLQLLPGEYWHGSVAITGLSLQGGAYQVEIWG